jgi:topoisomerase IA-like protein
VNAVMNIRVPQNSRNFLTSYKPVSFSRRTQLHRVTTITKCMKFEHTNVFVDLGPYASYVLRSLSLEDGCRQAFPKRQYLHCLTSQKSEDLNYTAPEA